MLRVVADLRTDARDAHVDGAVLAVITDAAQRGKDFFPGQNPPGVGHQQPEQIKLGAGQFDAIVVQPGFAQGVVDHQRAELQTPLFFRDRLRGFTASQQRLDPRQQQARTHRLAYVIVGAQVEAEDLVGVVAARGEHQDRAVIAVTDLAANAQAVFTGQHQVEDHQVRLFLDDARRRQGAIALDRHAQAIGFQVVAGQFGQTLVVFDNQYLPGFLLHGDLCLPMTLIRKDPPVFL
ncbi:hypothetical protein D3C87_1199520 [compost metagenome]